MNDEELLRSTLRDKAHEAGIGPTLDDVRRAATNSRRRSRWRAATAVAAAAVVVGVPSVLLERGPAEDARPSSPLSTPPTVADPNRREPSPSEKSSPDAQVPGLEAVPRGRDIAIPWISDGVIHPAPGADVTLPAGGWDAFTPYQGGWLLSGDALVNLDGNGDVKQVSPSGSRIVASNDGTHTAFLARGTVRVGTTSGEGENIIPVPSPDDSGPLGFLSSERVVYNGRPGEVLVLDPMDDSATGLTGLERAHSSTEVGDLVAGRTVDDECSVVSAVSGKTLWTKPGWFPAHFSPDGRFLAAYQTATGGEFETIGVLDARTGEVVATNDTANGVQAIPETPTAWEDHDSLLIPYRGGAWAVLRLEVDGTITRATQVFEGSPLDAGLVFSARP